MAAFMSVGIDMLQQRHIIWSPVYHFKLSELVHDQIHEVVVAYLLAKNVGMDHLPVITPLAFGGAILLWNLGKAAFIEVIDEY